MAPFYARISICLAHTTLALLSLGPGLTAVETPGALTWEMKQEGERCRAVPTVSWEHLAVGTELLTRY